MKSNLPVCVWSPSKTKQSSCVHCKPCQFLLTSWGDHGQMHGHLHFPEKSCFLYLWVPPGTPSSDFPASSHSLNTSQASHPWRCLAWHLPVPFPCPFSRLLLSHCIPAHWRTLQIASLPISPTPLAMHPAFCLWFLSTQQNAWNERVTQWTIVGWIASTQFSTL